MESFHTLYGERKQPLEAISTKNGTLAYPKNKKPNTDVPVPPERHEQKVFVTWLAKKQIPYYASANGGSRNSLEAVNLKRSGVQAGVPDICILIPKAPYHGLYIEMKRRKGGTISAAQRYWLALLNQQGYRALVANGADEAIKFTEEYLTNDTQHVLPGEDMGLREN